MSPRVCSAHVAPASPVWKILPLLASVQPLLASANWIEKTEAGSLATDLHVAAPSDVAKISLGPYPPFAKVSPTRKPCDGSVNTTSLRICWSPVGTDCQVAP